MSGWPPPPEVVVGGVLSVAGWLAVRLWNRLVGRVDTLEAEAVRTHDQRERDARLEAAVSDLRRAVTEGFSATTTAHDRLAAEIQRQSERQDERTSRLVAAVHSKVEQTERTLRAEIADVRRERRTNGAHD